MDILTSKSSFWFFSRKRIYIPVFCEFILFYFVFLIFNSHKFSNPFDNFYFSLLILNIWIFLGYVVGKYHIRTKKILDIFKKVLLNSLLINFIIVFLFFIFITIFRQDINNLTSFIKFFFLFNILSLFSQSIICKYFYEILPQGFGSL